MNRVNVCGDCRRATRLPCFRSGRLSEAPEPPPLLRGYATAAFLSLFRGGVCEKLSTTPSKREDALYATHSSPPKTKRLWVEYTARRNMNWRIAQLQFIVVIGYV